MLRVPQGGPLPNWAVLDTLRGLFTLQYGEDGITRFLNLVLGTSAGAPATSFDDGMSKLEFVLVSCKEQGMDCDFSSAQVPE
jgi:hypothetical protein